METGARRLAQRATALARGSARRIRGLRSTPPPAEQTRFAFTGSLATEELALVERVRGLSITSPERIIATADAVEYVVRADIPGGFAECGVWRGGMVLTMILTLQRLGIDDRDLYLYDTFEGMTEPGAEDTSPFDEPAQVTWERAKSGGTTPWPWFFNDSFSLHLVQKLLWETGYPAERIHFVVGRVEDTLPEHAPDALALLRLDTDWYESTRHELVHLYPRLQPGGVLLVDDYGHWEGCRRAVDEYLSDAAPPILLARTDYTGRVGVKG